MPRLPSGVYQTPVGTDGVPDTPILSTPYNLNVHDVESDLNTARPLVAGGTGASNAAAARGNLSAEVAEVVVTNFGTTLQESGSFKTPSAAIGAPVTGHLYSGIVYRNAPDAMFVEARDYTTGLKWVRMMNAGVWGAWTIDASDKLTLAGGTMTGALTIAPAAGTNAQLTLNKAAGTDYNTVAGQTIGQNRWTMFLGSGGVGETGGNAGSDFGVSRYNDAGTFVDTPLAISRSTGRLTIADGISGVVSGVVAPSGVVGELLTASNSGGGSIANGTTADVCTLSVPAGDWDIWGQIGFGGQTAGTVILLQLVLPANGTSQQYVVTPQGLLYGGCVPLPYSSSGTATVFLKVQNWGAGSISFSANQAFLYARRRR